MSEIKCFLLEETDRAQLELRRFCFSDDSPCAGGYHNATAAIEIVLLQRDADGAYVGDVPVVDHADPHWPVVCEACGYTFEPEDEWQVNRNALYRRSDTGEETTLHAAPPGAFWWAGWLSGGGSIHHRERGGGPHLLLRCPTGDWDIDSKSSNGTGWTRTGDPPNVTASPSIGIYGPDGQTFSYHGWLRDGVLVEC